MYGSFIYVLLGNDAYNFFRKDPDTVDTARGNYACTLTVQLAPHRELA